MAQNLSPSFASHSLLLIMQPEACRFEGFRRCWSKSPEKRRCGCYPGSLTLMSGAAAPVRRRHVASMGSFKPWQVESHREDPCGIYTTCSAAERPLVLPTANSWPVTPPRTTVWPSPPWSCDTGRWLRPPAAPSCSASKTLKTLFRPRFSSWPGKPARCVLAMRSAAGYTRWQPGLPFRRIKRLS